MEPNSRDNVSRTIQQDTQVILIGAKGFLGSHLAAYLKNFGVEILESPKIVEKEIWFKWIREQNLSSAQAPWIVNCGWVSTADSNYRQNDRNNDWIDYTEWIAAAALEIGANLLSIGSCLELIPQNREVYTIAKRAAFDQVKLKMPPTQWVWVRPYYIYSKSKGRPRVLESARKSVRAKQRLELFNPNAAHDFISIHDVVSAIGVIMRENLWGEHDIGTGFLTRVSDLIHSQFPSLEVINATRDETRSLNENFLISEASALRKYGWLPLESIKDLSHTRNSNQ
jgi:nucleoside-diphosphate-sugar epimerase